MLRYESATTTPVWIIARSELFTIDVKELMAKQYYYYQSLIVPYELFIRILIVQTRHDWTVPGSEKRRSYKCRCRSLSSLRYW